MLISVRPALETAEKYIGIQGIFNADGTLDNLTGRYKEGM